MKILVVGDIHGEITKLQKEIPKQDFDFIIGIGDYAGIDEWYPYIKYVFSLNESLLENKAKRKSPEQFFGKKKFKKLLKKDFEAGKNTLKFLDSLGKPGFFVFGNGDDEWYKYPFSKKILQPKKKNLNFVKKLKNIKEMTYKVRQYKGISFLGFGGYMDAKANNKSRDAKWQKAVDKRMKRAENKFNLFLRKIKGKAIFIFHYPPSGIFDKIKDKKNRFYGGSTGVDFYREGILKKKPFLVLCGHMHEYVGKKELGSSWVVNPGEGSKGMFAIVDIDEKKGKVKNVRFLR